MTGKLQAGRSVLERCPFWKKDFIKRVRNCEFVTKELSQQPLWHEAMTDLKDLRVARAKPLSKIEIKESATTPKVKDSKDTDYRKLM